MTGKIRKQVYVELDQEIVLKRLSKETGQSEAEIIRQAIDRHTRLFRPARRDSSAWEQEKAFIEHLIEQGRVSGRRTWRRDELHER
jgi:hypothetical protein